MSAAGELTLEELSQYFSFPISEAAKQIGVCATVLKKICRKNNIPRWPHRKIKSINKMIGVLESSLGKNGDDDARIREEIKILIQHREFVMKNPDALVKNYNKRKRDAKTSTPKVEKVTEAEVAHPPPQRRSKLLDKESSPKVEPRPDDTSEQPLRSEQPIFEEYITAPMMTSFPYYGQPMSMDDWMRMTAAAGGPPMLHAYGIPHAHLYAPTYPYPPEAVDLHHFIPNEASSDPNQVGGHPMSHPHAFMLPPGMHGMDSKWMATLPHSMAHGMISSPSMPLPSHGMQPMQHHQQQQHPAPQQSAQMPPQPPSAQASPAPQPASALPQPPIQPTQSPGAQQQQPPQHVSPQNSGNTTPIKQEIPMPNGTSGAPDMPQHPLSQQQFGMLPFPDQQTMVASISAPQQQSGPAEPNKVAVVPTPTVPAPSAQHMIQTGGQSQQMPEWFHEEKDNYMTLQERMGLV